MARRAVRDPSVQDDDSQKENAPGSSPPVSRNKGKEVARRVESEHEEDAEEDEEEEAGSPKGRKRARVNEEGDSVQVKAEKVAYQPKPKVLLRDKDQWVDAFGVGWILLISVQVCHRVYCTREAPQLCHLRRCRVSPWTPS